MPSSLAIVATVAGWVAAGVFDGNRVTRSAAPALAPGETGEVSLTILETPAAGVPLDVRLQATGVRLVSERLGWNDVVDPQARQPRIRVPLTAPSTPGTYRVSGLVTYVVCDEHHCYTRRAAVAWDVDVRAASES